MTDEELLALAIAEARAGAAEGGIPIGAALAQGDRLLGVGRNRRVQRGSAIRHGETDCLENVVRLPASVDRVTITRPVERSRKATSPYSGWMPCFTFSS